MHSNVLFEQRKVAIHLLRSGSSKTQVALKLHRSRSWVNKWWNRYNENKNFSSLQDRSRVPQHCPRKLDEEICREIIIARSELEAENAEKKHKVAIGAKSVQERLRTKGCKNVPSISSIERILRKAHLIQARKAQSKLSKGQFQDTEVSRKKIVEMATFEKSANVMVEKHWEVPVEKSSRSQLDITEHDSQWVLKLLQGKTKFNKLNEMLSEKLDSKEIRKLLDYVLNKPLRYRNRAAIILSYLYGIPKTTIVSSLFVSRAGIDKCIKRFEARGLAELLNPSWNIAKKSDDPRYEDAIFSILHAPPSSYGINRSTWRMEDIKSVMSDQGLEISIVYITKIIRKAGYKVRKAKKVLTSKDPDYKEKIRLIKNILSNLGEKEKFFSIDEYGPISIKLQGGRSLVPPGIVKTIPQFQKSKGSVIITGAFELSTNQMTHFYSEKKDSEEMLKLLEILLKEYREEECLYLSWDAASWHCSKKFKKKVEEINSVEYRVAYSTPLVRLAPLPSGAQFLNVIESVFSGMARAIIHNSDYASVEECKTAIDRHFSKRNQKFKENPKRAGNKIWDKERVKPQFSESNNCKDPRFR